MKIELVHDSLAGHIYEKASADEKTRKKIQNFIQTRYKFYLENKSLLKTEDLHYIERYLDEIELHPEERRFIQKSEAVEKNRRIMAIGSAIVIILVLAALLGWALLGWKKVKKAENILAFRAKELKGKQDTLNHLYADLKRVHEALKEAEKHRQGMADSLAKKRLGKEDLKHLSEEEKEAIILAMATDREVLQDNQMALGKQDSIINSLKVQLVQVKRESKAQIQKSKAEEQKRINKVWENKYNQDIQAVKQELNNAKSLALSAKARSAFDKGDLKTAFHLASEAYELNNNNKEAIKVLQDIAQRRSDVFDKKYGPSIKDPKQIIQRFNKTYGRISSSLIDRRFFQKK